MKESVYTCLQNDIQYTIWIGENAMDNWNLIDKADQSDLWFHVDGNPSAHVILRTGNQTNIPKQVIQECAMLCKNGSKLKNNRYVKVIYTMIRNVKKAEDVGSVTTKCTTTITI